MFSRWIKRLVRRTSFDRAFQAAYAAGREAANKHMAENGRDDWSEDDRQVALTTFRSAMRASGWQVWSTFL